MLDGEPIVDAATMAALAESGQGPDASEPLSPSESLPEAYVRLQSASYEDRIKAWKGHSKDDAEHDARMGQWRGNMAHHYQAMDQGLREGYDRVLGLFEVQYIARDDPDGTQHWTPNWNSMYGKLYAADEANIQYFADTVRGQIRNDADMAAVKEVAKVFGPTFVAQVEDILRRPVSAGVEAPVAPAAPAASESPAVPDSRVDDPHARLSNGRVNLSDQLEGGIGISDEATYLYGGAAHAEQQIPNDMRSVGGDYFKCPEDVRPSEAILSERGKAWVVMDTASLMDQPDGSIRNANQADSRRTKAFADAFMRYYYDPAVSFSGAEFHARAAYEHAKTKVGLDLNATFSTAILTGGDLVTVAIGNSSIALAHEDGGVDMIHNAKDAEGKPYRLADGTIANPTILIGAIGETVKVRRQGLRSGDYVVMHTDGIKPTTYSLRELSQLVRESQSGRRTDDSIALVIHPDDRAKARIQSLRRPLAQAA